MSDHFYIVIEFSEHKLATQKTLTWNLQISQKIEVQTR